MNELRKVEDHSPPYVVHVTRRVPGSVIRACPALLTLSSPSSLLILLLVKHFPIVLQLHKNTHVCKSIGFEYS